MESLTITEQQNLASPSPFLVQTISGTQQSTEKYIAQASPNMKKMLGKDTINLSFLISSIYSDLANPTTKYKIPGTLIEDIEGFPHIDSRAATKLA